MDNAQSAFDYFVSQGLAPHHAAGIVGNLQGESGQNLNPLAINKGDGSDGSDSIGIGQWNGSRAQALKEFAASQGSPWTDLNTQLAFLHSELKGPEGAAYARLTAARTPEEAGQAMLAFERPKDWDKPGAHPERAQAAARVFANYGKPTPVASIPAQAPPIFAPQPPQQQAQGQAQQEPAAEPAAHPFLQIPQMQAPPIFASPQRHIDLSKLKAALASGNRGLFLGRG